MARDAGLRRISSVTRWLALGVFGLSGLLALVASHAFHGRTVPSTTAPAAQVVSPAASSSGGLSPAASAPAPVQTQPVVVSGGS